MANVYSICFIREYTPAPQRRARPAINGHPRTPRISSRVGVSICTFQLSSCVSVRLSVGNQMTTFAKPKGNHCPYVLPHTHSNAETTRSRLADLAVHSRRRRVVCVSSVSSGVARWHMLLRSLRELWRAARARRDRDISPSGSVSQWRTLPEVQGRGRAFSVVSREPDTQ